MHHEARFGEIGRTPVRAASVRQALMMLHALADQSPAR
jgi:hypothetical protein